MYVESSNTVCLRYNRCDINLFGSMWSTIQSAYLFHRRCKQHNVVACAQFLQEPVDARPDQVVLFVVFVVDQCFVKVKHKRVLESCSDRRYIRSCDHAFFWVARKVRLQLCVDSCCKFRVFVSINQQLAAIWYWKVVSLGKLIINIAIRLVVYSNLRRKHMRDTRRRQFWVTCIILCFAVVVIFVVCNKVFI